MSDKVRIKHLEREVNILNTLLCTILKHHFDGSIVLNDKDICKIKREEGGLQVNGLYSQTETKITYFDTNEALDKAKGNETCNDCDEDHPPMPKELKDALETMLKFIKDKK